MNKKNIFYNNYHKKNSNFYRGISDGNATYYYLLPAVNSALKLLKKSQNIKVLDVGCGVGSLVFYVASKGFEVEGYDISSDAIAICNKYKSYARIKNVHFYRGDVEKLLSRKKYDLIICTEVIEHVEDDARFLKKLHRLCAKKGLLLLSTPSSSAPLHTLGLLKKFDNQVGHLRRYEATHLEKLLRTNKFRVLSIKTVEGVLRNSLYTIKPLGIFLKFVRGPIVPLFHAIDEVVVKIFGGSDIIVLAQKE